MALFSLYNGMSGQRHYSTHGVQANKSSQVHTSRKIATVRAPSMLCERPPFMHESEGRFYAISTPDNNLLDMIVFSAISHVVTDLRCGITAFGNIYCCMWRHWSYNAPSNDLTATTIKHGGGGSSWAPSNFWSLRLQVRKLTFEQDAQLYAPKL